MNGRAFPLELDNDGFSPESQVKHGFRAGAEQALFNCISFALQVAFGLSIGIQTNRLSSTMARVIANHLIFNGISAASHSVGGGFILDSGFRAGMRRDGQIVLS